MNKITYFEVTPDRYDNTVTPVAGTGARQTYNVTPAGGTSPTASLRADGPEYALSKAHWNDVVPYTELDSQVNPPVVTDSTRPLTPSPNPAQTAGLVPAMRPATKGKSFL